MEAYPQKRELKLYRNRRRGAKGIGSRIHVLSHMDVTYAGNAGAIAGRTFGLRYAHRQFAMHMDVPVPRSTWMCRSGVPESGLLANWSNRSH